MGHSCKDCRYEELDVFDEPCLGCIDEVECGFEPKVSTYWQNTINENTSYAKMVDSRVSMLEGRIKDLEKTYDEAHMFSAEGLDILKGEIAELKELFPIMENIWKDLNDKVESYRKDYITSNNARHQESATLENEIAELKKWIKSNEDASSDFIKDIWEDVAELKEDQLRHSGDHHIEVWRFIKQMHPFKQIDSNYDNINDLAGKIEDLENKMKQVESGVTSLSKWCDDMDTGLISQAHQIQKHENELFKIESQKKQMMKSFGTIDDETAEMLKEVLDYTKDVQVFDPKTSTEYCGPEGKPVKGYCFQKVYCQECLGYDLCESQSKVNIYMVENYSGCYKEKAREQWDERNPSDDKTWCWCDECKLYKNGEGCPKRESVE